MSRALLISDNLRAFDEAAMSRALLISDNLRAFDEAAMSRALSGRLQGAPLPAGLSVRVPAVHRLVWKPSRMADKTTIYAFAWCEGCNLDILRTDIGSD